MAERWVHIAAVPGGPGGTVTLVEGSVVLHLGRAAATSLPGAAHGLFFLDTRFLSRAGAARERRRARGAGRRRPTTRSRATFVAREPARATAGHDSTLAGRAPALSSARACARTSSSATSATRPTYCESSCASTPTSPTSSTCKEGRVEPSGRRRSGRRRVDGASSCTCGAAAAAAAARVSLQRAAPVERARRRLRDDHRAAARRRGRRCLEVVPVMDGEASRAALPLRPARRARRARASGSQRWRRDGARGRDRPPRRCSARAPRSADDLGALRIFDPEHPERAGRRRRRAVVHDACSAATRCSPSWMALIVDPDLALGVLETLARFQGDDVEPAHRGGAGPDPPRDALRRRRPRCRSAAGAVYYGTRRRHAAVRHAARRAAAVGPRAARSSTGCCPHADRALDWIERLRRPRRRRLRRVPAGRATAGLANQGWKDSPGRHPLRRRPPRPQPPIALCEVQGYVYARATWPAPTSPARRATTADARPLPRQGGRR